MLELYQLQTGAFAVAILALRKITKNSVLLRIAVQLQMTNDIKM